jgi:hypothetical protein
MKRVKLIRREKDKKCGERTRIGGYIKTAIENGMKKQAQKWRYPNSSFIPDACTKIL